MEKEFTLYRERGRYVRIRAKMSEEEISREVNFSTEDKLFAGKILIVKKYSKVIFANVGDTYQKIAARENVDENALKNLNFSKPVYPTAKIYVP